MVTIIAFFLAIGLLIDFIALCEPKVASILLYYELTFSIIIHGLVPYDYGEFSHMINLSTILGIFVVTVCSPRQAIIACTAAMTLSQFCLMPLTRTALDESATLGDEHFIINATIACFQCFSLLTLMGLSLTFAARCKNDLASQPIETMNLLQPISDGLILVREDDLSPYLAS